MNHEIKYLNCGKLLKEKVKNEIDEIGKLQHDILKFVDERDFKNNLDIDFLKKEISRSHYID